MKNSFIILAFFVLGLIFGKFNLFPEFITENDFSNLALYILMFLVGIGIGADKNSIHTIKKASFKIFLIPLIVIVGSIGGAALSSFLISDLSAGESMAVGAGFGYYSLSSIFITELHSESLGVVALLSNILREIITLLFAPLMGILFGKIAPIASGGATSMDTTLPIIIKSSGKEYGMISILNGIILTILVPFIVTFIVKTFT